MNCKYRNLAPLSPFFFPSFSFFLLHTPRTSVRISLSYSLPFSTPFISSVYHSSISFLIILLCFTFFVSPSLFLLLCFTFFISPSLNLSLPPFSSYSLTHLLTHSIIDSLTHLGLQVSMYNFMIMAIFDSRYDLKTKSKC